MNSVTLSTNKHQKTLTSIQAFAFNLPVRPYVSIAKSLLLYIPLRLGCNEEKKNRLPKPAHAASCHRK